MLKVVFVSSFLLIAFTGCQKDNAVEPFNYEREQIVLRGFPNFVYQSWKREEIMTLIKTKSHIKINRDEWEKMKNNPTLSEAIELLEDISALKKQKR